MYSYSTVVQKTADAGKILFWTINGLGISFYNPQIPARYKYILVIYAVIIMLWFTVNYPVSVYLTRNSFKLTLPVFAIYVQKFCENLAPVLLISRSVFETNPMKDRVGDLIYADQCLYLVGIEVWFGAIKRYLKLSFVLVTTYCVVLTGFYVCVSTYSMSGVFEFYSALLISLVSSSGMVYTIYLTYYFCSVMYLFKYRFQALNEEIMSMTMKKYMDGIKTVKVTPFQVKDIAIVKAIKFAHAIYRGYALAHNKRFGHITLLQFFQCTVLTVLNIYFMMNLIYQSRNEVYLQAPIRVILAISLVIQTIQNFVVLLGSTIFTCYRTSLEANNMENVIHELMSETEDEEILRELEDFSLELIHGKVVFTALDCFTIDYSLFTKIIGTVASYVIIFLQFGNFDYQEIFNNMERNGTTSTLHSSS